MSTTIYHVYVQSPNYSDDYTYLKKSWTDKVKADAHVAELEAAYHRRQQIDEGVRKVRDHIDATNPKPTPIATKDTPRWPSGLGKHQITQQMRDERMVIERQNEITMELNIIAYNKWQTEVVLPAINAYLHSMGVPEEKYQKYYNAVYTTKLFYVEEGQLD